MIDVLLYLPPTESAQYKSDIPNRYQEKNK